MAQPQELSPEVCYERALQSIKAGKLDHAIKLLQIASLKAPSEMRYREALREVKQLRAQQADTIDPEMLFAEAQKCIENQELDRAAKLLKIAMARSPKEARYRELLDEVRGLKQPKKDDVAEKSEQFSREASEDMAREPEPRKPIGTETQRRAQRRRWLMIGALVMVLFTFAAASLFAPQERIIDEAPYTSSLPVMQARAAGAPGLEELVLLIDQTRWDKMSNAKRESAARAAFQTAQAAGYPQIFLYTVDWQLIGTVTPKRVILFEPER